MLIVKYTHNGIEYELKVNNTQELYDYVETNNILSTFYIWNDSDKKINKKTKKT